MSKRESFGGRRCGMLAIASALMSIAIPSNLYLTLPRSLPDANRDEFPQSRRRKKFKPSHVRKNSKRRK